MFLAGATQYLVILTVCRRRLHECVNPVSSNNSVRNYKDRDYPNVSEHFCLTEEAPGSTYRKTLSTLIPTGSVPAKRSCKNVSPKILLRIYIEHTNRDSETRTGKLSHPML